MKTIGMNLTLVLLVVLGSGGCISQTQYDKLNNLYRTSLEQNEELKLQLEESQATMVAQHASGTKQTNALSTDLAGANQTVDQLRDQLTQSESALAAAQKKLAGANQRARALRSEHRPLPQILSDELAGLAQSNPQLMSYDKNRGMIKITSDLTFASGSDVVEDAAATGLAQLAGIFESPEADGYEVRIVGHTDNVPIGISKPQHPTNWHLSVHRSIAVMNALLQAGVKESRVSVAGYGSQRPIAANTTKGNRANRRVEILLVPGEQPGAGGIALPDELAPLPELQVEVPVDTPEQPEHFK